MVERPRDVPLADPRRSLAGNALEGLDRGEGRLTLEVLTWNLFHGRDHPPGEMRGGAAWRIMGRPVAADRHVLLNRNLRHEFGERLADLTWDIALLQEVPVAWVGELARRTGAMGRFALTSRNWMSPVTAPIWSHRPHLIGSWEGGSNLILVRGAGSARLGRSGAFTLRLRPERRRLHFVELEGGPIVFNLHASTGVQRASEDVIRAAALAAREAPGRPIIFGGDLNVRPRSAPDLFERIAGEFDLHLPGGADPGSIDQVLSGQSWVGTIEGLRSELREFRDDETGLVARLSDHDPIMVRIGP